MLASGFRPSASSQVRSILRLTPSGGSQGVDIRHAQAASLVGERIWTYLDFYSFRLRGFAAFIVEEGAGACGCP
jgi:hypothetical protein